MYVYSYRLNSKNWVTFSRSLLGLMLRYHTKTNPGSMHVTSSFVSSRGLGLHEASPSVTEVGIRDYDALLRK